MPISPDELAAYFNAATVVTGFELGVSVRRISLKATAGIRDRPRLMSLKEYIEARIGDFDCIDAAVNYVTVLLSGAAGRVIGLEEFMAYPKPHLEMGRLVRAYMAEAHQCLEPETDSALAIIIGWLKNYNGGDAEATFGQLWHQADTLLRTQPHRDRLNRMVIELKKKRILEGDEIQGVLNN